MMVYVHVDLYFGYPWLAVPILTLTMFEMQPLGACECHSLNEFLSDSSFLARLALCYAGLTCPT